MSPKIIAPLLAAAILAAGGCATVTRGSTEAETFTSKPAGAVVTTGLGKSCQTPCAMRIDRKESFWATFKHGRDVRKVHVTVKSSSDGTAATAGNFIAGGIIGVAVDAGSGATLDHVPNPVYVDFAVPQAGIQEAAEAYYRKIREAEEAKWAEARAAEKVAAEKQKQ